MSRAVTICQALLFRKFKEEFNATLTIVPGGIRSNLFSGLRDQAPVQSKSGTMPANHRFGSDHQEKPSPVDPKPARQHQEELVKRAEFWSGLPTLQYRELLAKRQILQK